MIGASSDYDAGFPVCNLVDVVKGDSPNAGGAVVLSDGIEQAVDRLLFVKELNLFIDPGKFGFFLQAFFIIELIPSLFESRTPISCPPLPYSLPMVIIIKNASFYMKLANTDAITTVHNPAMAIARLLMAPSISPISMALVVPMAWEAEPIAMPFATGSVM